MIFFFMKLGHQGQRQYSSDEIEKIAKHWANFYAKNESEKAQYLGRKHVNRQGIP